MNNNGPSGSLSYGKSRHPPAINVSTSNSGEAGISRSLFIIQNS